MNDLGTWISLAFPKIQLIPSTPSCAICRTLFLTKLTSFLSLFENYHKIILWNCKFDK